MKNVTKLERLSNICCRVGANVYTVCCLQYDVMRFTPTKYIKKPTFIRKVTKINDGTSREFPEPSELEVFETVNERVRAELCYLK